MNARKIYWFDPDKEPEGFRLVAVYEDQRGFYPIGERSNTASPPPTYIGTTKEEAEFRCIEMNQADFGLSKPEVFRILARSMRPDEFKAVRNPQTSDVTIWKNGNVILELNAMAAEDLHAGLTKAMFTDMNGRFYFHSLCSHLFGDDWNLQKNSGIQNP